MLEFLDSIEARTHLHSPFFDISKSSASCLACSYEFVQWYRDECNNLACYENSAIDAHFEM